MIFASNSPCKSYENEQNPYFSDFECNFRLLGGVFHKCSKSKYHRINEKKNFAPILAVKNTPFTLFCFFPPLACQLCIISTPPYHRRRALESSAAAAM